MGALEISADRRRRGRRSRGRMATWLRPSACFLAVLLALGCLGTGTAVAHNTSDLVWSIEPVTQSATPRLDFALSATAGTTLSTTARVTNHSPQPLALRISPAAVRNGDTGSIDLVDADSPNSGTAGWVTLDRTRLDLAAGAQADVHLAVTVPADAQPGDHVAALVAALDGPVTTSDGHSVTLERRVRALLTVRVSGALEPRLAVDQVHLRFDGASWPFSPRWVSLSYRVRNTGNVRLGAAQQIRARSLIGAVTVERSLDDLPELLPGGQVTRIVDIGHAAVLGDVRAVLTVEPRWPQGEGRFEADAAAAAPSRVTTTATRSSSPWLGPVVAAGVTMLALTGMTIVVIRARRRRAVST